MGAKLCRTSWLLSPWKMCDSSIVPAAAQPIRMVHLISLLHGSSTSAGLSAALLMLFKIPFLCDVQPLLINLLVCM